jgi:hypothetical protein
MAVVTMNKNQYVPALRYTWLTRFYDPIVALGTREQVFREKLLEQAEIKPGDRVLDLGCGTRDNIEGRLLSYINGVGFVAIEEPGQVETWFGTLDFLSAKRPNI